MDKETKSKKPSDKGINREQVNKLLKENELRISVIRDAFVKLAVKAHRLEKNKEYSASKLIPELKAKITEAEGNMSVLQEKRTKSENAIVKLNKLSLELHKKLEDHVMDSKRIQLEEHQRREVLSAEFAVKVKDVSSKLRDIEEKKTELLHENFALREDLSKCLERATAQQLQFVQPVVDIGDEYTINKEHEPIIHEDFRSAMVTIHQRETALQTELSKFTDRFQELSETIRTNNSALISQKSMSQDMDAALVRLEKQYSRGWTIYSEIKSVVAKQRQVNEEVKQSLAGSKTKVEKYTKMCDGLNASIEELRASIACYDQCRQGDDL